MSSQPQRTNSPRIINPEADIDWDAMPTRWRGGKVQARWAKDGEPVVKSDGTDYKARGGDVAILDPDGTVRYTVAYHLALAAYNVNTLPKDKSDTTTIVALTRNPEEVRVFEVAEEMKMPSTFSEDAGKLRDLHPGDLIEFSPTAKEAAIRPIWQSGIATRYITDEEARQAIEARKEKLQDGQAL